MFLVEIIEIMYKPVNPSFTVYIVEFKGPILYRHVFVMWQPFLNKVATPLPKLN